MPKKLKLTFLSLFIIVLLPTLIFSLYEITSFTQNEKIIENTYKRQLETVLFSVNQYTEKIITDWIKQIYDNYSDDNEFELNNFIRQTSSIDVVFISDGKKIISSTNKLMQKQKETIENLLVSKQNEIEKLNEYIKSEYRKPEAFNMAEDDKIIIVFICDVKSIDNNICGIVLNAKSFINEVLGPKAQEIAQEDINIFVFQGQDQNPVYKTDQEESLEKVIIEKPFWLLPGYSVGVSLKSSTISDILKPRIRKLLFIIILVNISLISGAIVLYRNIKGDMQLNQLKSEFISNVSHEIRTPLALIQMYIETLDMNRVKTEEKKKEYYNIILQETIRLSGIVNKILNFTQLEQGKRKFQFSDTNVNEILENIICTYRFHFENKGFEYKMELADDLPVIFADKEAINDAVINLIDNAIKYSAEKKLVILRTGRMEDKVFIEIKDFGIGITEKDQRHIFEKFYRVTSGDLAHKAKGTGLGLTIVKHIIDTHKGEIILTSKKGSGCSFKLVLPQEGVMA